MNYDVEKSRLPRPHASCVLEKCSITGGMYVSGGMSFALAARHKPLSLSSGTYAEKLDWISRKFFVFWDETDKRGWMLNGTTALLHLTRSSLEYNKASDILAPILLFSDGDLLEAPQNSSKAASRVLMHPHNRSLRLYEAENADDAPPQSKYYTFQNRVESLWEKMEKMIDHEAQANEESGVKMKLRLRRHLEGWDFKEVASGTSPVYHKVATLDEFGRGWVDLVRKTNAVAFLGRRFGELMEPSPAWKGSVCSYWDRLPKGRCYLAIAAADLSVIIDEEGDPGFRPIMLCPGLFWHGSPSGEHRRCRCNTLNPRKLLSQPAEDIVHLDLVHIILPESKSGGVSAGHKPPSLGAGGIVFGHNSKIPWRWGDHGDPEPGELGQYMPTAIVRAESNLSSVLSDTDTASRGSASTQTPAESQTLTEMSTSESSLQNRPLFSKTPISQQASSSSEAQGSESDQAFNIDDKAKNDSVPVDETDRRRPRQVQSQIQYRERWNSTQAVIVTATRDQFHRARRLRNRAMNQGGEGSK